MAMAQDPVEEVRRLEERLLDPGFRRSVQEVSALLADAFQEFGASGRRYDKQQILAALAQEQGFSAHLSGFTVREFAPGCLLATYRVLIHRPGAEPQHSLRSSLWVHREGRWQMLFHQATAVAETRAKK